MQVKQTEIVLPLLISQQMEGEIFTFPGAVDPRQHVVFHNVQDRQVPSEVCSNAVPGMAYASTAAGGGIRTKRLCSKEEGNGAFESNA